MSLKRDNIERFNEMAAQWDEDPTRVELAAGISASMLAALDLRGSERAFEFGCGTGLITLQLAPRVAHVTAMDSSPEMVGVLQRKCEQAGRTNVTPIEGSALDLVDSASYDLVFSAMALHHVRDTKQLLQEFFRILAPGGRVALADLDAEDGLFHDHPKGVAHHGFDRRKFESWLSKAGFGSVHFSLAHTVHKQDSDGGSRDYPVFLAVTVKPGSGSGRK